MSFLSSYKHYQDVSFQPLKTVPFMEWEYAKKELMFASDFNVDYAAPELWKFKHNYKKYFTSKKNAQWGILPHSMEFNNIDFSSIINYITTTGGVNDFHSIFYVKDKNKTVLGIESDNHTPLSIFRELMLNTSHPYYINVGGSNYFSSRNAQDPIENEIRYKVNGGTSFNGDKSIVSTPLKIIKYIEVEHEQNNDPDPPTYTYTIEPTTQGFETRELDCKEYTFAKAYYIKDSDYDDFNDFCYVPYSYYTEVFTEDVLGALQFAPIIPVAIDTQPEYNERKQKRMLRGLNVDVENIQARIADETIDDYRITLAAAPDDITKYESVVKYFADFFEEVGGEEAVINDAEPAKERNRSFTFTLNEIEVTISFNLLEQTITGTIPKGNAKEYKVKLKQHISNSVFYYEKVKQIYIKYSGVPASKTTKEMYDDMVAVYRANPDANDNRKMFNELPPSDCGRTSLSNSWCFYYGEIANMEAGLEYKLHADIGDEEHVRIYDIDSYKEHKVLRGSESSKYHAEPLFIASLSEINRVSNDLVCPVEGDPDYDERSQACRDKEYMEEHGYYFTDEGEFKLYETKDDSIGAIVYKQISPTEYKKFKYSKGKLTYTIDDRTAKVVHDKPDGTFRMYMLDGKLDGLGFKEYTSLFDSCLCGVAYTHVRVETKWYQSRAFQVIVAIIALVITVLSYGSLSEFAYAMVVAVAVGAVANYIANKVGGVAGAVLGTIVAIAIMVYIGYVDTNSTSQLWLTSSSIFIKAYSSNLALEAKEYTEAFNEAKKAIDEEAVRLMQNMEDMENQGHSKESIIARIANQFEEDGYFFSSEKFNEDFFNNVTDENWKLPEVRKIDYNLMDTKWFEANQLPKSTYDYYDAMRTDYRFGDTTNGQTII